MIRTKQINIYNSFMFDDMNVAIPMEHKSILFYLKLNT